METRANHLWVGIVTLILLAGLALFVVFLTRWGQGDQKEYDILFQQSVAGLAEGSQVSFAGVPVGTVSDIAISQEDPEFIRVRIKVKDEVPILIGTTATVQGSFTGVSTILLDGARQGAPAITCETTACLEPGIPQIPPADGGFNAILANAPLLLERLATLTERLTQLLDDRNQSEITAILANTNQITDQLADQVAIQGPELQRTLVALQGTLNEASGALSEFQNVTRSTDSLLNQEGAALAKELRGTLNSANKAAASLSAALDETRPATRAITQQLTQSTLPAAEATMQDLRKTSAALRKVTERLEQEGATSLLSSPPLPDYEPE
ncbi:MlaD family protein [Qipengyuania sp. JC766]|uniref:MlaD family protein n=1 Tax=Qipengyuania sp. JC766 TaxID=3232139 RepID=UPI00345A3123